MKIISLFSNLKRYPWAKQLVNNGVRRIHFGIAKGFKRRGGLGIFGILIKESTEELFIKSLDLHGKILYDVGANFGAFTLYFIKKAGQRGLVVAFDPLVANVNAIKDNIHLNKLDHQNYKIYKKGLGDKSGKSLITYDPDNTSRASINSKISEQISKLQESEQIEIEIDTLDNIIKDQKLPAPDFIKIDVEGFENEVLIGGSETLKRKPQLFIEMHGADEMEKNKIAQNVITTLLKYGYSIFHVEKEIYINNDNFRDAKEGHLFCI